MVWYGRSIGSGPALRAVHRITQEPRNLGTAFGIQELKQQPGGVVLQCGFANFPEAPKIFKEKRELNRIELLEVAGHLFGRVAKRLVNRLWPNEVGGSLASFQVMSFTFNIFSSLFPCLSEAFEAFSSCFLGRRC